MQLLYNTAFIGAINVIVGTIISSFGFAEIAFKLKSNAVVPELRATEYFDFVYLINYLQIFSQNFHQWKPSQFLSNLTHFLSHLKKNMAHAKEYYSFMIIKYFTIKFVFFGFFQIINNISYSLFKEIVFYF